LWYCRRKYLGGATPHSLWLTKYVMIPFLNYEERIRTEFHVVFMGKMVLSVGGVLLCVLLCFWLSCVGWFFVGCCCSVFHVD
jgi:hypothetical protein